MAYFMLYETATGRPISLSSVEANPIPSGMTSVDIGAKPTKDKMWDETTKTMIDRPPKVLRDRLEDLRNRPAFQAFWQSLNAQQKIKLRDGLIWLLGKARWRNEDESQVVDE